MWICETRYATDEADSVQNLDLRFIHPARLELARIPLFVRSGFERHRGRWSLPRPQFALRPPRGIVPHCFPWRGKVRVPHLV